MYHDHVMKKLIFDVLTSSLRVEGGRGFRAKYLLQFDMPHDHFLKKWNFDLLIPTLGLGVWGSAEKFRDSL